MYQITIYLLTFCERSGIINMKKIRRFYAMKDAVVRIEGIEIENFKNVRFGSIRFDSNKNYKSSILGLYGQNGSGKTALIDAIELLKLCLSGKTIPVSFADHVNVDAEYATLRYTFKVINNKTNGEYEAIYEISLRKEIDESIQNTETNDASIQTFKSVVFNEILSCSYKSEEQKVKLLPIIDTRTDDVFVPASKYNLLIGTNKKTKSNLLSYKKLTETTSRSFIFAKELLNELRKNRKAEKPTYYHDLIEALIWFGNYELFVVNTSNSGLITLDALPLTFRYDERNKFSIGNIMVNLNHPTLIPNDAYELVTKLINNMNIVLTQIVPGLKIGVKNLGNELSADSTVRTKIEIVSLKNSKEIPLKYESEGIKKIISILQLLIVLYNKASITVAVDEFDSGVFEYLLGEMLRIISEKGKGQLIFTSHNLRPLETLDKSFIAFTTTNPDNRYIRFTNIKTNNNLRDFYYRDIVLGEQNEPVYEPTNNYEIALAFREAGELSGS